MLSTSRVAIVSGLLVAAAWPRPAGAGEGSRIELGVHYGVSFLDVEREDDWGWERPTETWTGGLLQGVSLGVRLGERILAEARFGLGPSHQRGFSSVFVCEYGDVRCMPACAPDTPDCLPPVPYPVREEQRMVTYEYGAGVVIDLAGRDVQPLLILGAGGVTYGLQGYSETDFRLAFGLGLRREFGRVGVRVEIVDFVSPDFQNTGDVEHDLQVLAGVQVGLR